MIARSTLASGFMSSCARPKPRPAPPRTDWCRNSTTRWAKNIKHRAQDSRSAGVLRQDALREEADPYGYIEPLIWSGIGRARSGCGSAIVGNPEQVLGKMQDYIDMGIRAFILSGYPHLDECELFARHVLPHLKRCKLADVQGRRVAAPVTPLTTAERV